MFGGAALVHSSEVGHEAGLEREASKQGFAEGMDGLDLEAAAGVEHSGKKPSRRGGQVTGQRRRFLAGQRPELGCQVVVAQHGPTPEAPIEPVRHLGRRRLGKGQTKDVLGPGAGQHQAQYAVGQHSGLAGAGRSRDPDRGLGLGCLALFRRSAATAGSRRHQRLRSLGSLTLGAATRPFAHPGQMVIVGPARRQGRPRLGPVGRGGVVVSHHQAFQSQAGVLHQVDHLGLDVLDLTGRIATREAPVREQRNFGRVHLGKAAGLGDQGFEGELGGAAGFDLLGLGQAAGLVVDDSQAAVFQAVDAVGLGPDAEVVVRQPEFPRHFTGRRPAPGRRQVLKLSHHPGGDALEAGPPEGQHTGPRKRIAESLAAAFEQFLDGLFRQFLGVAFEEEFERLVDHDAAFGGSGIGVDWLERLETEQTLGVKRIGIADPGLDVGYRQRARPGWQWRPRCRRQRGTRGFCRSVEAILPEQPGRRLVAGPAHFAAIKKGFDAQQPARGHGGRTVDLVGARQHDLGGCRGLDEVVCRQTNAAFRLGQADGCPHGPAEPGIGPGRGWPGTLVEAAQHDEIGALQPGFQKPPDEEPRMAAKARPHRLSSQQGIEESRIGGSSDRRQGVRRLGQLGDKTRGRFAGLAGPQALGAGIFVRGREGFGQGDVFRQKFTQRRLTGQQ